MARIDTWLKNLGVRLIGEKNELHDLSVKEIHQLLDEHGVILFDHFEADSNEFGRFTEKFSNEFIVHGSPVRKAISEDGRTKSVNPGTSPIALHSELHYTPFSPDIIWFYCNVPPTKGGQTTLADGVAFYEKLSSSTRKLLSHHSIRYTVAWSPQYWKCYLGDIGVEEAMAALQKAGAINCRLVGEDIQYDFDNAPIVPVANGKTAFANSMAVHAQYRINRKAFQAEDPVVRHEFRLSNDEEVPREVLEEIAQIEAELTRPIQWEKGQFVMIDNRRIMHGRLAVGENDNREIFFRLTNLPKKASPKRIEKAS